MQYTCSLTPGQAKHAACPEVVSASSWQQHPQPYACDSAAAAFPHQLGSSCPDAASSCSMPPSPATSSFGADADAPSAPAAGGRASLYKGLTWDKYDCRWRVRINVCGKQMHVGRYDKEEAAARAYDRVAVRLLGEHAPVNFTVEEALADNTPLSPLLVAAQRQHTASAAAAAAAPAAPRRKHAAGPAATAAPAAAPLSLAAMRSMRAAALAAASSGAAEVAPYARHWSPACAPSAFLTAARHPLPDCASPAPGSPRCGSACCPGDAWNGADAFGVDVAALAYAAPQPAYAACRRLSLAGSLQSATSLTRAAPAPMSRKRSRGLDAAFEAAPPTACLPPPTKRAAACAYEQLQMSALDCAAMTATDALARMAPGDLDLLLEDAYLTELLVSADAFGPMPALQQQQQYCDWACGGTPPCQLTAERQGSANSDAFGFIPSAMLQHL